ncbi:hypothetical protein SOASR032_07070 [Pragia fontium]|uniref:Antibiotic biosynthesis monooxygenase n=1 Tax=Pragia fontium TaxID=82985 RepID=A0ABQ5LHV7_9GAMM|nr:hypothetical protein SOASR032_07070 [Pragia fontium]
MIIARTWHGCVPLKYWDGFAAHLQLTGVQHSQSVNGNLGAFVRQEIEEGWAHFFLVTYWDSYDSIKAFAGDNYSIAVTYQDDEVFELLSDPFVFHHEVSQVNPI